MEWLKELIESYIDEDKRTEFEEKFNKAIPLHYMPKGKYNEVAEELKIKKSQVEDSEKLIKELESKSSSVEEYEKRLEELSDKYKNLETDSQKKIEGITKTSYLKELLTTNKMHKDAIDLYVKSVDLDALQLIEGKLPDESDYVEGIKKEKAGLFMSETSNSDVKSEKGKDTEVSGDDALLRQAMGL